MTNSCSSAVRAEVASSREHLVVAALERVAGGALHPDVGSDPAQDDGVHAATPQLQIQLSAVEGAPLPLGEHEVTRLPVHFGYQFGPVRRALSRRHVARVGGRGAARPCRPARASPASTRSHRRPCAGRRQGRWPAPPRPGRSAEPASLRRCHAADRSPRARSASVRDQGYFLVHSVTSRIVASAGQMCGQDNVHQRPSGRAPLRPDAWRSAGSTSTGSVDGEPQSSASLGDAGVVGPRLDAGHDGVIQPLHGSARVEVRRSGAWAAR